MKPKSFPLFEVRPYSPTAADRSAPPFPLLFADLFDCRIAIRDKLDRLDLPATIRRPGPGVAYPPRTYGGLTYNPAIVWLFADTRPTTPEGSGQILICYRPANLPPGVELPPYKINAPLLRMFREAFGYSQADAATRAGFSPRFPAQQWYSVENPLSTRTVNEQTVERLALLFDVHPRQLLNPPHNAPPRLPDGVPESAASTFTPLPMEAIYNAQTLRQALNMTAQPQAAEVAEHAA